MDNEIKEATKAQKERLSAKGLNRYELHLTDSMLEEIESIATMNGAKVHHRTNKPIIKDTVLSLLELGIKAILDGVDLPKKPNTPNTDNSNRMDLTVLDERIEDKLKPLHSLISELTDKINRIPYTVKAIDTDNSNRMDLTVLEDKEATMDNITPQSNSSSITEEIALSESSILPVNEVSPQIVPDDDLTANNDDIQPKETEKDTLDIGTMLDSFNIKEGVIEDSSLLYGFFTDVFKKLNRKVTVVSYDENGKVKNNNLSKIPNYYHHRNETHKLFDVPPQIWEHLTAIQKDGKGKWIWTRI